MGKSLLPWLENPEQRHDEAVFIQWNGPNNGLGDIHGEVLFPEWMTEIATPEQIRAASTDPIRSVVTADGWKFNCSPLGEHELYNLKDDPGETRNCFEQEKQGSLVHVLADQIRSWQDRTEDTVTLVYQR